MSNPFLDNNNDDTNASPPSTSQPPPPPATTAAATVAATAAEPSQPVESAPPRPPKPQGITPAAAKNDSEDDDDSKDPFLSKLKESPINLKEGTANGVLSKIDKLLDFRGTGSSSSSSNINVNTRGRVIALSSQKLTGVSGQLLSEDLRAEIGVPTCMSIGKYIAIGTTHGLVLIFDAANETLRMILGAGSSAAPTTTTTSSSSTTTISSPTPDSALIDSSAFGSTEYGPVTAIDQPTSLSSAGAAGGGSSTVAYTTLLSPEGSSFGTTTGAVGAAVANVLGQGRDDWVLVGYYSGTVTLWDASSGRVVRTVAGAHTSPVSSVRWLGDSRAITVGLRGTSYVHNFGYRLFKVWDEKEPLVDLPGDKRVVVTAAEPLHATPRASWFTDPYSLIALAFREKVFVFGFIPGIASKTALPCRSCVPMPVDADAEGALPCLSWRPAARVPQKKHHLHQQQQQQTENAAENENSSDKSDCNDVGVDAGIERDGVLEPLLAVGWGRRIVVARVRVDAAAAAAARGESAEAVFAALEVAPMWEVGVEEPVTTLTWLNAQTVVYTTSRQRIHVIDPFARQEVDCRSVAKMELIYHGRFVSPRTGEPVASYAPAACRFRGRLYLLGLAGLFRLHVLPWEASVQVLVEHGRWLDAMAFLLSLYELRERATFGLPRSPADVRRISADKLLEILRKFVCVRFAESLSASPTADVSRQVPAISAQDAEMCAVCMHCALKIGRPDFVFDELYPLLQKTGRTAAFCDSLEPFVAAGRVRLVPTRVLEDLLRHLIAAGRDTAAERCVLAVDPIVIDARVNQICLDRHFFTAIMHYRSKRTGNYVAPLNTLLTFLVASSPSPSSPSSSSPLSWRLRPDLVSIGRLLLDYITCVMSGCEFPQLTKISPDKRALTAQATLCAYFAGNDSQAQALAQTHQRKHPRLFYVLCMGLRRFLDEGFGPLLAQGSTALRPQASALAAALYDEVACECSTSPQESNVKDSCTDYALRFLGERYGAGECDLPPGVVGSVITSLCARAGAGEKALTDAIRRALGEGVGTAEDYIRETVAGRLYAVAEWLYDQTRQFGLAVQTRAKDPARCSSVFALIRDYAAPAAGLTEAELGALKAAVLEAAGTLVTIDSTAACELLLEDLEADCATVLRQISAAAVANGGDGGALEYRFLRSVYSPEHKRTLESKGVHLGMDVYETFITLMCKYGRDDVPRYLEACDDYPIDFFMKACDSAQIKDGLVILYERAGDVTGAVKLLAEITAKCLETYENAFVAATSAKELKKRHHAKKGGDGGGSGGDDNGSDKLVAEAEAAVRAKVRLAIKVCSRNAERVSEDDLSKCWFYVLDALIKALRELKEVGKNCDFLTEMTQSVLDSMSGYVGTNVILGQIMADYKKDDFGTFKPIILGMLESLSFEKRILDSTTHMLQEDVFDTVEMYLHSRRRAATLRPATVCDFCGLNILTPTSSGRTPSSDVVLFKCGHQYHARCYKKDYCEKCYRASKQQQLQRKTRSGASFAATTAASATSGKSRLMRSEDKYAQRLSHFDNTFRRNKGLSLPTKKKGVITVK